jgi:hypothetical protein
MSCSHVRDRLPEYVLDVLPASARREVERHLRGCPGCASETAELRDGAAAAALELPVVAPPPALEDRVVHRVRAEVARSRRRPRAVARVFTAAAMAAVLLAAGAIGGAVAMRGQVTSLQKQVQTTRLTLKQLEGLLSVTSGNGRVLEAKLVPVRGLGAGQGGTAIIFVSPSVAPDWVFMDVVLADSTSHPYRVLLQQRSGKTIDAGALTRSSNGRDYLFTSAATGAKLFAQSLGQVTSVVVVDRAGRPILTGAVRPYTEPS